MNAPCKHPEFLNRDHSYADAEGHEHDVVWCGGCGDELSDQLV